MMGPGSRRSGWRCYGGTIWNWQNAAEGDKNAKTMGLGLALCRDIVTVHGGAMEARNLREGGTEFCFTLPLKEERQHGAHKG